jgi:hypothetical protein
MGRRQRVRRRKALKTACVNVSGDPDMVQLFRWLSSQAWRPTAPLRLTSFPHSGRGLMAMSSLQSNSLIVSIPKKLLVTRRRAVEALNVHDTAAELSTHDLLAVFLLKETSLGHTSFWLPYLQTLPTSYSVPYFCTSSEMASFPPYIRERCDQQTTAVQESFARIKRWVADLFPSWISPRNIRLLSQIYQFLGGGFDIYRVLLVGLLYC